MTIYGLLGIALFLALVALSAAVWWRERHQQPIDEVDLTQPETWHPMLVRHGNLHESEDTL